MVTECFFALVIFFFNGWGFIPHFRLFIVFFEAKASALYRYCVDCILSVRRWDVLRMHARGYVGLKG